MQSICICSAHAAATCPRHGHHAAFVDFHLACWSSLANGLDLFEAAAIENLRPDQAPELCPASLPMFRSIEPWCRYGPSKTGTRSACSSALGRQAGRLFLGNTQTMMAFSEEECLKRANRLHEMPSYIQLSTPSTRLRAAWW